MDPSRPPAAMPFREAVAACFERWKNAGPEAAIALPDDRGRLRPARFGDEQDAALIADLAAWREAAAFAYPTVFRVTLEGTRRWLEKGILQNPTRLLFLVLDPAGKRLGHVGLAWSDEHPADLEAENIVRGRHDCAPGAMTAAMRALLTWAAAELPAAVFLQVFADNERAIRFYRRLGFLAAGRRPLRRHEQENAVVYRPCAPDDRAAPDKVFLRMIHAPAGQTGAVGRSPVDLARAIRRRALTMVHRADASHIGGGLSAADLLAHLYGGFLRVDPRRPDAADRDRLLISKGHIAATVYAALAEAGFFHPTWLDAYSADDSPLAGHVTARDVPGVELSTGSLGHGLSVGAGLALAARRDEVDWRTVVLLSDGECDEGSIWEAALFAATHQLDNLIALVDHNGWQGFGRVEEVAPLAPFAEKWRAFGWAAREIDGHDHAQLAAALAALPYEKGKPSVVIARTIKGKGVSFMENRLEWHYRAPDKEQLARALAELEEPS